MLVHSDYYHDNRVVREAELLAAERYKVTVLAIETGSGEPFRSGHQNGVEVITCRVSAASGKRRFISVMRVFWRRLKSLRADIIHAHDLDTLLPAWRYARSRGIPLVYDSHELYLESTGLRGRRMNRAVWSAIERMLIHRADSVITVCDSIAGYLQEFYKLDRKPEVIRNFAASQNTDAVTKVKIPVQVQELRSRVPYLAIYQGVLREGRGLDLITDVIQDAANWGLVICGSGPMTDELSLKIAGLQSEYRIVMTGQLPHNVLSGVTGIADAGFCYIEPISLSYRFALPNKLSEYIQAGVPVIGSDLPEIRHLIDEHHAGYVCSTREQIIQALNELEIPENSARIRHNLKRAAPLLSWQMEGKKLVALYEKLV
ncbi:MAG: glycosyltransferase [Rhodothermaceae bacterium]|nr:glycosyltransferase [Rhodothermaceae bacterium]